MGVKVMRFIVESGQDDMGRTHFTVEWHNGERERGQCFHANLVQHVADAEERGWSVEIRDERPARHA